MITLERIKGEKVGFSDILNAKISDVNLFLDRGCLCISLTLDMEYETTTFGDLNIGSISVKVNAGEFRLSHFGSYNLAALVIGNTLMIAGVDDFAKLKGSYIRIAVTKGKGVVAIGHVIENKWFCPGLEL